MSLKESRKLFRRAQKVIPGGVNSPVRAFGSVGGTPPFIARSGKTWPGATRSCGPHFGSQSTWIVRARSAAEIPVVVP